MTHDELLATIDWIGNTKNGEASTATNLGVAVLASLNALRAVVELHKPGKNDDEEFGCRECSKLMMDGSRVLTYRYPCPTIKAIEKELV